MDSLNLMNTLSSIMNKLQEKGMAHDFRFTPPHGFTIDGNNFYKPQQMSIVKIYRFEEMKDPGDLCVLYLIKTDDGTMGYILDAYGTYANDDNDFENALRLIPEKEHKDQLLFTL